MNCEAYSRLKRTMTSRLSGTKGLFSPFSRLDHVKRGAHRGREPQSETSNTAIILFTWSSWRINLNQRKASMKNANGVRLLQHRRISCNILHNMLSTAWSSAHTMLIINSRLTCSAFLVHASLRALQAANYQSMGVFAEILLLFPLPN